MDQNNQMGSMDNGMKKCHTGMHWVCCWNPLLSTLCWVVALISVVYAWAAISRGGMFWGMDANQWFWSALTLGILSVAMRRGGAGEGCACGGCGDHGKCC